MFRETVAEIETHIIVQFFFFQYSTV